MSSLIEFPSGTALQIQKDKIKSAKFKSGDSLEYKLLKLVRFYIDMNRITSTEVIYSDAVANTALDFVKEVCDVVGFCEPKLPSVS